ncbi:MAG: hypothetical protein KA239_08345 [Bacteroidia bacterium]|nr:hypothetical protein [Bacteroidia bacterium]
MGGFPTVFPLWRRLIGVGGEAGVCGFAALGILLAALLRGYFVGGFAAFFIASPLPLSKAFFVRDFEGFGEGNWSALPIWMRFVGWDFVALFLALLARRV